MIISQIHDGLRLITQNDHACFAGELLSLWRRDRIPGHPRRESLLFAAREHDNGWREVDAAPYLNPETGRPFGFRGLPEPRRVEAWQQGIRRFADSRPYASLLITQHALRLHRSRRDEPSWRAILEGWRRHAAELAEHSGAHPQEVTADDTWIELSDTLSLILCEQLDEPVSLHGYRARRQGHELTIDPFPFAGATTFELPYRKIDDRRYESETGLAVELASSRWQKLRVRVVPA